MDFRRQAKNKLVKISLFLVVLTTENLLLFSAATEKQSISCSTYQSSQCLPGHAYILMEIDGQDLDRVLNGKLLKPYYPRI
jgi:hypothetical protein